MGCPFGEVGRPAGEVGRPVGEVGRPFGEVGRPLCGTACFFAGVSPLACLPT